MGAMSEKDLTKRLWLQVAAMLIVMTIGALVSSFWVAKSTADRSIRNENTIELKANKAEETIIHYNLEQAIISNKNDLNELGKKVDDKFDAILKKIDNVNENILDIYKQNQK